MRKNFSFFAQSYNGILEKDTYLPVVIKAWKGIEEQAIQENGFVGWVQGISASPGAATHDKDNTADFGVGAVLLAGSEIVKLMSNDLSRQLDEMIVLCIGKPNAFVKNVLKEIDSDNSSVVPFEKDNKIFMPLRFIAENLGADVHWDGRTSSSIIVYKTKTIKIMHGVDQYIINGEIRAFETSTQEINGRIFVPIRMVAEAFDKKVYWDDRGLIFISDNEIILNNDRDKSTVDQLIKGIS